MAWRFPDGFDDDQPAGIAALLESLAGELGPEPLLGTTFMYDGREMLTVSREIEASAGADTVLFVGFQNDAKLSAEAGRYRDLVARGVEVVAFGEGDRPAGIDPGVRWIALPHDRHAVENQWFLVTTGPEPLAFVGYETSAPEKFGVGGATGPDKFFAGFVSDDRRLIGSLERHLRDVATDTVGA